MKCHCLCQVLWTLNMRFGFSRESATYIRRTMPNALVTVQQQHYFTPELLESSNVNVKKEAEEIKYNVPEAFILPSELF